jgi:hypothetical protein
LFRFVREQGRCGRFGAASAARLPAVGRATPGSSSTVGG